jgi:hypothetical protein
VLAPDDQRSQVAQRHGPAVEGTKRTIVAIDTADDHGLLLAVASCGIMLFASAQRDVPSKGWQRIPLDDASSRFWFAWIS